MQIEMVGSSFMYIVGWVHREQEIKWNPRKTKCWKKTSMKLLGKMMALEDYITFFDCM